MQCRFPQCLWVIHERVQKPSICCGTCYFLWFVVVAAAAAVAAVVVLILFLGRIKPVIFCEFIKTQCDYEFKDFRFPIINSN